MSIKQPKDQSHFILPDLGEGVQEAELIKWRVSPGDQVEEHQTLAEMETDKALVEVPSPWAGTIKELHGSEGDIVQVGSTLVTYDTGDGQVRSEQTPAPKQQTRSKKREAASDTTASGTSDNGEREDSGTVVGSVGGQLSVPGRFARRPEEQQTADTQIGKALATPAVRRIARELGVDINRVPATGRGGRVTAGDVQAFAEQGAGAAATTPKAGARARHEAAPAPSVSADGVSQKIPFRGVRRKIAQSLDQSVKTAVHFTVVDEADVTALDKKRREYANVLGRKLSFLPFVMTAICKGLRQHPSLNANVDDAAEEILIKGVINLGCAVDTEHGLMVPVINNADQLSLVQLADAVSDVAEGCRNRTIDRERLQGGTFTISNVGSDGGMFATPIINYPEVAILASGRVHEKVLARDGAIYAGKVMPLSLSCDHRVVDGAEGARFLTTMVKLLEDPERLVEGA